MGNNNAPASSLVYPSRRGWLIAFGVTEILMGLFCLLFAAFVCLFFLRAQNSGQMPGQPSTVGMLFGGGLYVLFAAFFFAGGIGTLLRKNWARIVMLIGSCIWLVFGLLGVVFLFILLPNAMQSLPNLPPGDAHVVLAVAIAMEVAFGMLLPLGFLIFYTRKSVKATFQLQGRPPTRTSTDAGTPSGPVSL